MEDSVIGSAAIPSGVLGIIISTLPSEPYEWLIFFSTGLILCQLVHWLWRFKNYIKKKIIK